MRWDPSHPTDYSTSPHHYCTLKIMTNRAAIGNVKHNIIYKHYIVLANNSVKCAYCTKKRSQNHTTNEDTKISHNVECNQYTFSKFGILESVSKHIVIILYDLVKHTLVIIRTCICSAYVNQNVFNRLADDAARAGVQLPPTDPCLNCWIDNKFVLQVR